MVCEDIFEGSGDDEDEHLPAVQDIHTPCGKLVSQLDIPLEDGTSFAWAIVNPCALIWWCCSESKDFLDLLFEVVLQIHASRPLEEIIGNHVACSTALLFPDPEYIVKGCCNGS